MSHTLLSTDGDVEAVPVTNWPAPIDWSIDADGVHAALIQIAGALPAEGEFALVTVMPLESGWLITVSSPEHTYQRAVHAPGKIDRIIRAELRRRGSAVAA